MTNSQMIPRRFERMARARKLYKAISTCFSLGGNVVVGTYTRSTRYQSIEWFRLDRFSVSVRRGKAWNDITHCAVKFLR